MAAPSVPNIVSEEYYQISEAILDSFPKYRPPLDLFRFRDDLVLLTPYSAKGTRLSNEQVEEVHRLCLDGNLFVSRSDHHVYSDHIIKQLNLVLSDDNLKQGEVAEICLRGLAMRLDGLFEQPIKIMLEPLYVDCMVVTEFLWQDIHRLKLFMRRLHTGVYSLINQSLNSMMVGLWLLQAIRGQELTRKEFDRAAMGFLLHDIGMTKISTFITSKTTPLTVDEKDKIPMHPLVGAKLLDKLDLTYDEIKQCSLEHHERLDGSGYPRKFKDNLISKMGRICAVADSFAAMIQDKPYSKAVAPLEAGKTLASASAQYDKTLTARLLAAYISNEFSRK